MAESENVEYGEHEVETTVVSSSHATIEQLVDIGEEIYREIIEYCKKKRYADGKKRDMAKGIKVSETSSETSSKTSSKTGSETISESNHEDKLSRLLTRYRPTSDKRKHIVKENEEEIDLENDEYRKLVTELQKKYKDFNASFPIFIRWTVQTGDFDRGALREFLRKHAITNLKNMEDFLKLQTKYVTYLYKAKHPHWNTKKVTELASQLMESLIKEEKTFKDVSEEVEKEMAEDAKKANAFLRQKLFELLKEKKAEKAEKAEKASQFELGVN